MGFFQVALPGLLALLGIVVGAVVATREERLAAAAKGRQFRAGQLLGVASAVCVITLVVILLGFNPYRPIENPSAFGRFLPILLSAGLAGLGSLNGRASWLVIAFSIGFFPFWLGLYLLGTPGVFKWIPVAQLGFVGAAWLIFRGRASTSSEPGR